MATHSCSCLENPRDSRALWAAVYGVTESDTNETTWQQQQCFKMYPKTEQMDGWREEWLVM